MKVLHILSSSRLSGAENVAADIIMMFQDEYKMAYASPTGSVKKALSVRDVPYVPMEKVNVKSIKVLLENFKPDIIHAHDFRASVMASFATSSIPIISHLHVNSDDLKRINVKTTLYLLALGNIKKVITVSKDIHEDFIFSRSISNKVTNLRNIIYKPRINILMDKDPYNYKFDFVYIGRLEHQKNPQRIAKVASIILKRLPGARFGIIGEGSLMSDMKEIFKKESVIDQVTFTGNLPYPYKALKQSKCLLMCSRFEGTPIVALEAMSLGVPIVSTPVDGLVEIFSENESNGFLNDNNQELANSVINILTNEDLYRNKSVATSRRFSKINQFEKYKNELRNIYENVNK